MLTNIEEMHEINRGVDFKLTDHTVHGDIYNLIMDLCLLSLNTIDLMKVSHR